MVKSVSALMAAVVFAAFTSISVYAQAPATESAPAPEATVPAPTEAPVSIGEEQKAKQHESKREQKRKGNHENRGKHKGKAKHQKGGKQKGQSKHEEGVKQ